jgi:putative nucleotidyltransferase with HDIG domain
LCIGHCTASWQPSGMREVFASWSRPCIIGREGRNIRAFEQATGIDVIIDDTPEAVILSGFDPIRRETARISLEKLVADGRIHPGRIEEVVARSRQEVDEQMMQAAEEVLYELGIHGVHPEIVKTLGRLKFRSSYGQNQLIHAREVALVAANMAAEMGMDVQMTKRMALLHDIGHLMHDLSELAPSEGLDDTHEELAHEWLALHFPAEVYIPVKFHVLAKRYLCTVDHNYETVLRGPSLLSYRLQGGKLSPQEVGEFESSPYFDRIVQLRKWDDLAKVPGRPTPLGRGLRARRWSLRSIGGPGTRATRPSRLHRGFAALVPRPAQVTVPEARLGEAARTMLERDVSRLVVVDGSAVVGILSRHDALRALLRSDAALEEAARAVVADTGGADLKVQVTWGEVELNGQVERLSSLEAVVEEITDLEGAISVDADAVEVGIDDRVFRTTPPYV